MPSPIIKATIKGDADPFLRELRKVDSHLSRFGRSVRNAAATVGVFFGAREIGRFVGSAVSGASDLEESLSRNVQLFGDQAAEIEKWAKAAAGNLGLSQTAALDAAGTFAIFGDKAGLTGGDLTKFSTSLGNLAADMASFSNTSVDEAITAIGAGLRGESEPLRKFGVLLDDATLKSRALTLGIYDGTGSLTQQQRVLAAQAEILAQTTKQQGDFARTSDGLANQQRILSAEFANVKAELGQQLLPVAVKFATFLNNDALPAIKAFGGWMRDNIPPIIDKVAEAWEKHRDDVEAVITAVSDVITAFIDLIRAAWGAFGDDLMQLTQNTWGPIRKYIDSQLQGIRALLQAFAAILRGDWRKLGEALVEFTKGFVKAQIAQFEILWQLARGGFQLLKDAVVASWDAMWSAMKSAASAASMVIMPVINAIKAAIEAMVAAFNKAKDLLSGGLPIPGSGIIGGAIDLGGSIIGGAGDALGGLFGRSAAPARSASRPGGTTIVVQLDGRTILEQIVRANDLMGGPLVLQASGAR